MEVRRYIDFIGGMDAPCGRTFASTGGCDAVRTQLQRFAHTSLAASAYDGYVRLNALAPFPTPAKTLLVTSGAEALENAVKIAHFHPDRRDVVVFTEASTDARYRPLR
ncbi:aminotransferase class III-fold pyridoxal phosphate-dependent enzyme [Mesorhizobium onobrychidis]|nr:aminotransferase class III-fold pyridoxal phosphate-dependent enzyme [Mesorhizobium onobrychidis]